MPRHSPDDDRDKEQEQIDRLREDDLDPEEITEPPPMPELPGAGSSGFTPPEAPEPREGDTGAPEAPEPAEGQESPPEPPEGMEGQSPFKRVLDLEEPVREALGPQNYRPAYTGPTAPDPDPMKSDEEKAQDGPRPEVSFPFERQDGGATLRGAEQQGDGGTQQILRELAEIRRQIEDLDTGTYLG